MCAKMNIEESCDEMKKLNIGTRKENIFLDISFEWAEKQNKKTIGLMQQSPELSFLQDIHGNTFLHKVISIGNLETSLWVISLAPEPSSLDLQNDRSYTALHEAVAYQETVTTRRLVVAGANPTIRTFSGNTALHIACMHGYFGCAKALIEPFTFAERFLRRCKKSSQTFMVTQDLEMRNFEGKTCLHLAASNGFLNIVALLVYSGANVETGDGTSGKTALHLAIQNRHRDVARFLARERPACMEVLTWSGYSAYQFALETDPHLAKELLELGANSDIGRYDYSDDESMSDSSCGA